MNFIHNQYSRKDGCGKNSTSGEKHAKDQAIIIPQMKVYTQETHLKNIATYTIHLYLHYVNVANRGKIQK